MRRARRAALALATLTLVVSVVSTGGFSSVSADRTVDVAVANDSRAYLSISEPRRTLHSGENENVALLTLRNRFATDLTHIEVTVDGDGATSPRVNHSQPVSPPESLAPGGEGDVVVTVVCGEDGQSGEFRVAVDASGPGGRVDLNRTVTLTCPVQTSSGQAGSGTGNETSN